MFSFNRLSQVANRPEQTQIFLGLIAIVAFIFGIWQLKTSIRLPIGLGNSSEQTTNTEVAAVGEDVQKLQQQDSDSDGLTDYDELYIYKTSPYLTDTDSDTYSDKTELDSGNDPNCATGTSCKPTIISSAGNSDSAGAPTAAEIRALLKQAGATDEQIASYDDATLMSIYGEVSGELGTNNTSSTSETGSSNLNLTPEQKDLIKNMSGSELRQFLINGGADAASLEKIDDNTLKTFISQELGI